MQKNSVFGVWMFRFGLTYFLLDSSVLIIYKLNDAVWYLSHHLICICIMLTLVYHDCFERIVAALYLVAEVTNPLLQLALAFECLSHLRPELHASYAYAAHVTDIVYLALFLLARSLVAPMLLWRAVNALVLAGNSQLISRPCGSFLVGLMFLLQVATLWITIQKDINQSIISGFFANFREEDSLL